MYVICCVCAIGQTPGNNILLKFFFYILANEHLLLILFCLYFRGNIWFLECLELVLLSAHIERFSGLPYAGFFKGGYGNDIWFCQWKENHLCLQTLNSPMKACIGIDVTVITLATCVRIQKIYINCNTNFLVVRRDCTFSIDRSSPNDSCIKESC